MYNIIANVNNLLYYCDENKQVFTTGHYYEIIKGEALGLRAFLHFEVYRMFSPDVKRAPKSDGIPYNKEFGVSLPPMYSAEETIQLIINDLKEAEQCLQNDPIEDVVPYEIRTTTDQGELREAIRHERRVELGLEFDRFYDLVRWGIAKEVLHAAGKTNYQDKNALLPLPQTEIDKSKGVLVQNPDYQ